MSAGASPRFTIAELVGVGLFLVDLALGPASLLVVIVVLATRRPCSWWLTSLALLNLLIASWLLGTVAEGLGGFVALVWFQALASAALVIAGLHPALRARVFGAGRPGP